MGSKRTGKHHNGAAFSSSEGKVCGDLLVVADGATSNLRSSLKIGVDFYDYKSGYLVVIMDRFPEFDSDRFCINENGFVGLFLCRTKE